VQIETRNAVPPPPFWTRFPGLFFLTINYFGLEINHACSPEIRQVLGSRYFFYSFAFTGVALSAFAFATVFRKSASGWDKFFAVFNLLWILLGSFGFLFWVSFRP
jgi:hypothetical protein